MRWPMVPFTCALAASLCRAEPISISGLVTDSATGKPLSCAIVKMSDNRLADTTHASGAFTLAGQTGFAGTRAASHASSSAPVLAPGGLRLGLAQPGQVGDERLLGPSRGFLCRPGGI